MESEKTIRSGILGLIILLFVLLPLVEASASIWQKQRELENIQRQIGQCQSKIDQTKGQISSLKGQLGSLNSQISQTELEIRRTGLEIERTNWRIAETNKKIEQKRQALKRQKRVLGEAIKYIYEEGETPFVVTLLSSVTFSEILDRTEYLTTAEQKIEKIMEEIEKIKADLVARRKKIEGHRNRLVDLKKEQDQRRVSLSQQQSVKNNLLALTKNKEAAYKKKLSSLAQRQAAISQWLNEQIYRGGSGGYPWGNGPPCLSASDSYGYYQRQCVSYVAWKRAITGRPVGRWGSAGSWGAYVHDQSPRPGDVMWFSAGGMSPAGHVAYVESVNSSSSITISEYNWGCDCCYGRRTVNPHNYGAWFIH